MWTSLLPNSGRNGYGQAAFTICEPDGQVKFSVCYRQLGIADTGSFWSLRSDKQMDVKLFTEFLQKKKRSIKKHGFYGRLIFLIWYKVKSLKILISSL